MAGNDTGASTVKGRLGVVATAVAVALVITYLVLVASQWRSIEADGLPWSRRQELLTGIEALAFAAVGALLGTTVQRQATQQAEARAQRAETEAVRHARDAEKGRALQRTIEARRAAARGGGSEDPARGARGSDSVDEALAELTELAHLYDETG